MLHADILQMNIKSLFSGEDSLQTCKGPFTQGEFLHSIFAIFFNCWSHAHMPNRHIWSLCRQVENSLYFETLHSRSMSVLQQWTSQINLGAGKASPVD